MGKKGKIIIGMFFLAVVIFTFGISATNHTQQGYCCERLENNGPWCQPVLDSEECATGTNPITGEEYKSLATSCDQTSYCTLGTCVNERDGFCSENVPQQKCLSKDEGFWTSDVREDVAQCQVGCCTFGDSAQLVTSTRCNLLSANSGLEAEFNPNVNDEWACIASIPDTSEGACVYQRSVGSTGCERLTKAECDEFSGEDIVGDSVEFYEGKLCSSPDLGTICGMTERTTCDAYDVYFVDSCGNKANIYDADRVEDPNYWSDIIDEPTCGDGSGNKNSETCGDCEYNFGSICGNYEEADAPEPDFGDNICKSLDCEYEGETYLHGESWCAGYDSLSEVNIEGEGDDRQRVSNADIETENLPGSVYVKMECRSGRVLETSCDPKRNEVCAGDYTDLNDNGEKDDSDYTVAQCVPNRWQGCIALEDKETCEDQNYGDCQWIYYGLPEQNPEDNEDLEGGCFPKFAPGFNFWEEEGSDAELCESISTSCQVKYEQPLIGKRSNLERTSNCIENCYCIPGYEDGNADDNYEDNKPSWHPDSYEDWIASLDLMCSSMGDCGSKINYIGEDGVEREDVLDTSEFR